MASSWIRPSRWVGGCLRPGGLAEALAPARALRALVKSQERSTRLYPTWVSRPAKYTAEQILDACLDLVAADGPAAVSIPAIGRRLGAASGSIYYRFRSRDLILGHLWVRTVKRAQLGFLQALEADHRKAPVEAALHIVRWSRTHLPEARVLLLYRRRDLAHQWPDDLSEELETLNDDVERALRTLARDRFGKDSGAALQTVAFALVDVPYAAVRRHLVAGVVPPGSLDDLVARTVVHLLDLEPGGSPP